MTERKHTPRRIYGIFFGAYSAFVGLLLIIQVWGIYALGNKSFTVENISNAFSRIAVPVLIWVAAFVGVVVLAFVFPEENTPVLPSVELRSTLAKLSRRLPETDITADMKRQSSRRVLVWSVCLAVCLVCVTVAAIYLLGAYTPVAKEGFFASHEEAERLVRALPWIFAALGAGIAAVYLNASLYKTEISLVKTTIAENAKKGVRAAAREEKRSICDKLPFLRSKWFLLGVRIAVGVLAVVFIILGVNNGGMADVLAKAVKICTQCIGLG